MTNEDLLSLINEIIEADRNFDNPTGSSFMARNERDAISRLHTVLYRVFLDRVAGEIHAQPKIVRVKKLP